MKMVFHAVVCMLMSLSCLAQGTADTLDIHLATWLAKRSVNDRKVIDVNRQVFIIDEANIHTLRSYQYLQEAGYLKMFQTDSVYCCRTYRIEMLAKSDSLIDGSLMIDGLPCPIVKTVIYDSVVVTGITDHAGYYEIEYEVVNPRPTPFHVEYHQNPDALFESYKTSCFVRNVNGSWQIDKDNRFRGFPDE